MCSPRVASFTSDLDSLAMGADASALSTPVLPRTADQRHHDIASGARKRVYELSKEEGSEKTQEGAQKASENDGTGRKWRQESKHDTRPTLQNN